MISKETIGQANAVLVLGDGARARAVVTGIESRTVPSASSNRLSMVGPVTFERTALQHLHDVVLNSVDQIIVALGLRPSNYELAVGNVGLASSADVGLSVGGYSADVSVFMALLSASLQIPIANNCLFTGHIASPNGRIAPVRAIESKVRAAIDDAAIDLLFLPRVAPGDERMRLSKMAGEEWTRAVSRSKSSLRVINVTDMGDLLEHAVSSTAVVLGSLKTNFFLPVETPASTVGCTGEIVSFLTDDNPKRFWQVLEMALLSEDTASANELFTSYIRFWNRREKYPDGIGQSLRSLVTSLPPHVRHTLREQPACLEKDAHSLAKLTDVENLKDMRAFLDANEGLCSLSQDRQSCSNGIGEKPKPVSSPIDSVLAQIEPGALDREIGGPLDNARGAYALPSSTVAEYEQFLESISSFYLHLLRHSGRVVTERFGTEAGPDALALLNRAYARSGGFEAAWSNAKFGEQGGLRSILDTMTDRFKQEEIEKRVNLVLKEAFDPLEPSARMRMVSELLVRLAPHLPPDLREQPPQRYAGRIEEIARAYAQSLHNVTRLVRSM